MDGERVAATVAAGTFVVSTGGALVGNYQRVRRARSAPPASAVAPSVSTPTPGQLHQVSSDAARFDAHALRATRSVEAGTAVTAAITVLAIQLLHKDAPALTTVGFSLAAAAFGVSIVASLMVIRTPIQVDERRAARQRAMERWRLGGPPSSVSATIMAVRHDAWMALTLRLTSIIVIALLLIGALGCMAAGQFSVQVVG